MNCKMALAGALVILSSVGANAADLSLTSEGKVPGTPFELMQSQIQTLQGQINQLQQQIATIQLTPGPTGPQGPKGDKGDTGAAASSTVEKITIVGTTTPILNGNQYKKALACESEFPGTRVCTTKDLFLASNKMLIPPSWVMPEIIAEAELYDGTPVAIDYSGEVIPYLNLKQVGISDGFLSFYGAVSLSVACCKTE